MKADANGFLIADRAVSVESLAGAMKGVKGDTAAILALLKVGARATITQRARVLNSGASRGPSAGLMGERLPPPSVVRDETGKSLARVAAALARERDERGRFKPYPTAELTEVAKAVKDMTRRQAAEHAEEKRERAKRSSKGAGGAQSGPESPAQASGASNGGKPPRGPQSGSATPLQAGANTGNADATRDARGRFVGKGGGAGEGGDGASNAGGGRAKREREGGEGFLSKLKGLFTGFKSPNMPGVEGYDKVDPTVEASKELGSMIKAPLAAVGTVGKAVVGRGFSAASKLPAAPWYRRILRELHLFRGESSAWGLAETRVLHDIERRTGGGAGGDGGRGGLLGSLAGGIGGLLGKGGGLLGSLFGLGKGMLKRLPILGALFAGGSALASMFGGDDPNKSPEENRQSRFEGAGSGIGAIIGGALGSFLGPVGTLVGGVIGDKVGELVGAWLATVDWSKVGDTITSAWDGAVSTVKDTWKTVTDELGKVTKTVSDAWNGVIDGAKAWLKDKLGIDVDAGVAKAKEMAGAAADYVKEKAAPVVDAVKEKVAPVVEAVKGGATAAVDYGKERVEKMAAPIANATANAVDWGKGLFGKGSAGNKAAVMAEAQKITDPNERAMFLAQVDHESGGFRSTVENTNYKAKGFLANFGKRNGITTEAQAQAILDKGDDAKLEAMYGGAWGKKNLGNTEAGDGAKFKGRGVMQLTGRSNYAAAGKALGIDLVNHPELLEDPAVSAKAALWYWNSRKGLSAAGKAGDINAATTAINGGSNGLADRKAKYGTYLAAIKAGDSSVAAPSMPAPTATVAAAAPPPAPPVPPSPVAPATAPPTVAADIPQPLNSPGPIDVRVSQDSTVGQDLSDRRLAQIATGGISA
jgi:predicted chitinase